MGTFSTREILQGSASVIPVIADHIKTEFQKDGYEVIVDVLSSGGYDISITKGGIFKTVLGMKTALKIMLLPRGNSIYFDASVGIWGQQLIPTIVSVFFFWPVLITQIWGVVEQSKLDDRALDIARSIIYQNTNDEVVPSTSNGSKFCTWCGTKNESSANFCKECGQAL